MSARANNLRSAAAVRAAGHRMLEEAIVGELEYWSLQLDRLPEVARYVANVTRQSYPDLRVPFHSRWRHFHVAGIDRWSKIAKTRLFRSARERARTEYDLAIISVLLDAGSGGVWRYLDRETGLSLAASEGLALASLDLFASGVLSAVPGDPLRADAARLTAITQDEVMAAFQVTSTNPLAGLEGRVALLNRLGHVCQSAATWFHRDGTVRPGHLFDKAAESADPASGIPAPLLLRLVLNGLGPIWPSRIVIDGVGLGDAWPYPRWDTNAERGIVPFHKLSQWLTYSLLEPSEAAGISVTDMDGLTGLAEYRNGGLFVDLGVVEPRSPDDLAKAHEVGSPLIVEWRALTVALVDLLAPLVRAELGISAGAMPLASLLQGGTWSAGRKIASLKRQGGQPPIRIVSDGTTF